VLRGLISFPDQSLGGGGRLPTIPREGVVPVKGRNPQGPWEPSPSRRGGGQKVQIDPGKPAIFKRNSSAYLLWSYANATLQLAKNSQGYLREKLLKILTEALSLSPFVSAYLETNYF